MSHSLFFLTIFFALLSLLCLTVAWQQRDGAVAAGLRNTWDLFRATLPLFLFAVIFAGFMRVLIFNPAGSEQPAAMPNGRISVFISTMIFIILLAGSMFYAYTRHDGSFNDGLKETWRMFSETWLLLVVAWVFAGYIAVLLPADFISQWLGRQSGMKGIILACVAGGLTPGGPFVSLPIVAALYRAGAGEGVVVAYLSAWSLYALGRMPFEISFLGPQLTMARFVSILIFPPLSGIVAKLLFER